MRRPFMIGAVLLACFSATFGASRDSHAAHQAKAMQTVRVGIIPVGDLIGFYTAIERGYFAKQGIKIQVTPMSGGAVMLPALEGGSLDVGFSNVLSMILAKSHGFNLVAITPGDYEVRAHPAHAILVGKGSSIHSAADLEGKTIAVNTLNSIDHVAMQQWLQKRGVDPAKVHFTEVDFPQMVTPLMHGQVDAALASEPFVTVAKSLGAEVIGYDFADLSQRTLLASFVAQRSWVKAHQSLVKRFALAFEQGQKYANKHSATARSYITKFTPIPAAVVNTINLTSWRKLKASDLSYWVKLGVRWHALDKSIKVNGLMWPTAR